MQSSEVSISAASVLVPVTTLPVTRSTAQCSMENYCCKRELINASFPVPSTSEQRYIFEVAAEGLIILESTTVADMPGWLAQISDIETNETERVHQVDPFQRLIQFNFGKIIYK